MKGWQLLAIFALGCGPGRVSDGSAEGSDEISVDDGTVTDGVDTETGVVCEPPKILCDGECVSSETDENCGSCGHVCDPYGISGHCENGRCTARQMECFTEEAGFTTCREYCSALGEQCGYGTEAEWHPCWNKVETFYGDDCGWGAGSFMGENPEDACDWQIPWGEVFVPSPEMFPVQSVFCCCTQHGGE